jgi:hypothetical protein
MLFRGEGPADCRGGEQEERERQQHSCEEATRRLLNHVGPVRHQGAIRKQAAGTARDRLADSATLAAGTVAATYLFDPIPTTGSLLASQLSQQVLPTTTNTSGHAYTATASATGEIRAAHRLWGKISEATIFRAVQLLL